MKVCHKHKIFGTGECPMCKVEKSKSNFEQVKEFQTAFNQPVADKPQMMNCSGNMSQVFLDVASDRMEGLTEHLRKMSSIPKLKASRIMLRASLISEELAEFLRAKTLVDQVDALTDILYLVYGTAVEIGVDLDPCLEIVHVCNMAKLGLDGKPIVDEQGKVRKPVGWVGPETMLAAEIERQSQ